MPVIDGSRFGVAVLNQDTFRICQMGGGYAGKTSPTGMIYFPWLTGQSVVNDQHGGGHLGSGPSAAGAHIVARGSDGNIWYTKDANGTWTPLPAKQMDSAPAICVEPGGVVRVVARGPDGHLWHTSKLVGGSWAAWIKIPAAPPGGGIKSAPSIGSGKAGTLNILVQGNDNAVWHLPWHTGEAQPKWQALGGQTTAAPTCCWWGNSTFHVFCRGLDNQLWHTYFDWSHPDGMGRWRNPLDPNSAGWANEAPKHPKGLSSGPVVVADKNGRVDIFARTPGAEMSVLRWAPETGWQPLKEIRVNSVFYPG
jgi:hypothetical protein